MIKEGNFEDAKEILLNILKNLPESHQELKAENKDGKIFTRPRDEAMEKDISALTERN